MHSLAQLLCCISDQNEMERVLHAVLTDAEREAIDNRLQIIRMLVEKRTHRDISQQLGVGIATVTRGAHAFKEGQFDVLQHYLATSIDETEFKIESD